MMKDIPSVLALIKARIEEHKKQVEASQEALEQVIGHPSKDKLARIQDAAKQLILKDKVVFHKAIVLALEDLKKDIEN